jgi:hypothetical protein
MRLICELFYIGYKQREKISRALKTRSQAILTALERYNKVALALNPPADTLLWQDIVKMATLANFDLLRLSHIDIRTLPWAQPAAREAMALHFGIKRAVEEIDHLNVEIHHLVTYMVNDMTHVGSVANGLKDIDGPLSFYLTRHWTTTGLSSRILRTTCRRRADSLVSLGVCLRALQSMKLSYLRRRRHINQDGRKFLCESLLVVTGFWKERMS